MPYLDVNWDIPRDRALNWFVATPGTILLIIFVGLLFRWFVNRAIDRVVARASQGSLPSVIANSRAGDFLSDLRPGNHERRRQRAQTMGSLLKSISTGLILAIVALVGDAASGKGFAIIGQADGERVLPQGRRGTGRKRGGSHAGDGRRAAAPAPGAGGTRPVV